MYKESDQDTISTERTINALTKTCIGRVKNLYEGIDHEKVALELMRMHGLSKDKFDFLGTVDKVLELKGTMNAVSIDDNANKSSRNIMAFIQESIAPVRKAIGFDYYYRTAKKMYGEEEAKRLFGKVLDYTLGLADETSLNTPYSYYGMTPILIKSNGKEEIVTLKNLFERYKFVSNEIGNNAWQIDCSKIKHKVDFVAYHRPGGINNKRSTYRPSNECIDEDVELKVWDTTNGWVDLKAITKHKNEVGFTVYQTNRGDYAFVTNNHPIIMSDKSEKNASELKIGDEILKEEVLPEFKEFINVPEKLAYILGFIFGDGYCKLMEFEDGVTVEPNGHVKTTKNHGSFAIAQKDIENHIITKYVTELFGDCVWGRNESIERQSDGIHETFTSHWLAGICSCYFGMSFQENAHTKSLPCNVMNWKKEAKEAFVAGLIDSDGTVFKNDGRVDIRVKAYGLACGLYDLLRTIEEVKGINKRITFIKRYGNTGGKPGSDECNANSMLFGTAFKPSRGMRKFCQKLQAFTDEEFEQKCMAFREESSNKRNDKITKIVRFNSDCILSPKFKSELEDVYDITTSTGRFYANGMVQHNCWSFNASLYVIGGKNFGTYRSLPPENVGEYVGGICEIVHEFASNLAGALAIGTFFFDIAHILLYSEKIDLRELRSSSYLRNSLKSEYKQFIRSVNNVSRNGIESPFTNVSLFDRPKVKKMIEEFDWYFPFDDLPINSPASIDDQEKKNEYYRDFLCEYINELQDLYLDVFDKGDQMNNGIPYTFPVTTMNVSKAENNDKMIVDMEFLKDICNREIYRYNIFASKGSKIASCCFKGNQVFAAAITSSENEELAFEPISFERAYYTTRDDEGKEIRNIHVMSEGRCVKARVIRIEYTKPFVAISFEDGSKFITTDNHKNAYKVSDNWYADKESSEVEVGDVFFTKTNDKGMKVTAVNTNIPNNDKYAYCLEITDKDTTHFDMPNGVLTHNCRLINDMEMMDLASQSNSFGAGGSVSLGSDRVITNNTLRIAIQAKTKDDFYRMIAENMEDSAKLLKAHKELIKELEKQGTQPFITAGWIDLNRMFSTFGIIGTYETAELFKKKFGCPEDFEMEVDLLRFINTQMEIVCKKYGIIGNIEQIPGESFAVRLMKADKMLFPNEDYLKDRNLQSNQLVPLWLDCSIWDRMEKDGRLNRLITGGGIVHLTIGEKTTPSQSMKLIKFSVQCGCEHFALNPIISQCEKGHVSLGTEICPECGEKIVVNYSRIIGYFRPVSKDPKYNTWGPRAEIDFPFRVKTDKSLKNIPKEVE